MITQDPHTVQDVVDEIDEDSFSTYVSRGSKIINFSDSDTTMAFCFFCNSLEDALLLYESIEEWQTQTNDQDEYLISIKEQKQEYIPDEEEGEIVDDFELL